jgi:Ca-activated chloride channel family protein
MCHAADDPRIRADSELVMVNATVLDRTDHIVADLRPEQVSVLEDGVPQSIRTFALEDVPVSLAIVLDLSGSMRGSYAQVREALSRFSTGLNSDDEYTVITFRAQPSVQVPFTSDPARLESLVIAEEPKGSTALIDSLVMALNEVKAGRNKRKAIVILSDCEERSSRYTWSEFLSMVREAGIPIYAFMLRAFREDHFDYYEMGHIAEESGGRIVDVGKARNFPDKLNRLEIHQQYVIGYRPHKRERDGKFRKVTVKLSRTPEKWRVYWRRGYYAPD